MPTSVSRLPVDKRGFPVPWISCWDSEENCAPPLTNQIIDTPGFLAQMMAPECDHVAGRGVPDLGSLCPARQLDGMLNRLCDVCGDFIPPGAIYFMGAYDLLGGAVGFRECGLHYECALYSAQVCPGLVTAKPPSFVGVFEATAYVLQPQFLWMDPRDGVKHTDHFLGWDDPRLIELFVKAQSDEVRMALMGAYAVPLDPIITRLSDWVTLQSQRENA